MVYFSHINIKSLDMNVAITEGIKIQVASKFLEEYSHLEQSQYFFRYTIEIENNSQFIVQLLRRDWYVYDSLALPKVVSGDGVVGKQPILKPGETYVYSSGCGLNSEIGYMTGSYTFRNLEMEEEFPVLIPRFDLCFPGRLN